MVGRDLDKGIMKFKKSAVRPDVSKPEASAQATVAVETRHVEAGGDQLVRVRPRRVDEDFGAEVVHAPISKWRGPML